MLVLGIGIGTNCQGQVVVAAGDLLQCIPNRLGTVVDQFTPVDEIGARLRDHDVDLQRHFLDDGRAFRLGQANRDLGLLDETRRHHEEDQQQEHDVDERRQVDLRLGALPQA